MTSLLSPRQVAQAIGVSESSLKRWADEGAIRAVRTAGGHRRIPLAEAIRFIRSTGTQVVQPSVLGLSDLNGVSDNMPAEGHEATWLRELLEEGKEREARGFVLSLYLTGRSVESICDGPVQHAMENLGELWEDGPNGIFIEHRAAEICLQALHQLQLMIDVVADAPVAIGGAGPEDPYLLPTASAAATLKSHGFRISNLGARTPLEALSAAARSQHARLVWLCVSTDEGIAKLRNDLPAFASELQRFGTSVIVGGRCLDHLKLGRHPNLFRGASMAELGAFAQGILARTSPAPSEHN